MYPFSASALEGVLGNTAISTMKVFPVFRIMNVRVALKEKRHICHATSCHTMKLHKS